MSRKSIATSSLPPGIRQRGPVWQVDVTVRGSRRTGTAATLQEAIALREELQGQLSTGTLTGRVWTLQIAIEKCYEGVWSNARSGLKLRANAEDAALYLGATTKITDITTDSVDGYITHLKKQGNAGPTINRKLAALSKVLSFAMRRADVSGLKSKPHLERQKEHEGRLRWLTVEEERELIGILTGWNKPDHVAAVTVLIDTGLRGSELWRLEQRDIDFTKGTLTIWQTKNAKPRSVPMTQRVKEIVARRMKLVQSDSKTGGKARPFPYNNDWLGDLWDRVKLKMGLKSDTQFVPYALRHTCASRLVQRGVNLRVVQEWMGHKTITVTMRYSHLSPTNLLDAVHVLNPKEVCHVLPSRSLH